MAARGASRECRRDFGLKEGERLEGPRELAERPARDDELVAAGVAVLGHHVKDLGGCPDDGGGRYLAGSVLGQPLLVAAEEQERLRRSRNGPGVPTDSLA